MTISPTLNHAWSAFGRWRRGRPFWGGLFLVVSGLEFYVSAHMDLMPVKVSFGSQGFLSWVIPLGLLLCGLLVWLTPAQRIFYGILGATVSVAALIGLNLGGFFVGMLLGIVGGALAFSWTPVAPVETETVELPEHPEAGNGADAGPDIVDDVDRVERVEEGEGPQRSGGPLTDDLPTSTTSPLGVPPVQGGRHSAGPEQPPGRATGQPLALVLVSALATAGLLSLPAPPPAAAAPCPAGTGAAPKAAPSKATTPKTGGPTARAGAASPKAPAAAPSTSTPSPSPAGGGNPAGDAISGFFDGVGRLLGTGGDPPGPTPTPAPTPSSTASTTTPAPKATGTAKPTGSPKPSGCGTPMLAVPAGQPLVNERPSLQIAATLTQSGLSYDGIVDLPTHSGTIRVLQFSISSSTSTPFELQVPALLARTLSLKSSKLTVSGHVRFFTTEIKGNLLGLVPVTFTPDAPPPLVPPELFFTSATVKLVFVQCDVLTAPGLNISYL